MAKFLRFKPDPFRPIDVGNEKKWKKVGKSYVLKHVDKDLDKQHIYAEFKHIIRGSGNKGAAAKAYNAEEKLWIAGMANANIIDRMDERVDPRGLDTTDYVKNMQLLAHHSYYCPIGQVDELDIREDGVRFTAWVGDPSKGPLTDMQREIRSLIAQGILKTVSIGFIPKKIRPGAYDDRGRIVEPWVIEEWELLELSVVAIPANQDSIFEMKGLISDNNNGKVNAGVHDMKLFNKKLMALLAGKGIAEILEELTKAQAAVYSLVFDASVYSKDTACAWADSNGFKSNDILESDGVIVLQQKEVSEFLDDTFEELSFDEGVKAMVGKSKAENEPEKDGTEVDDDGSSDTVEATFRKESMTLIKNINESTRRTADVCAQILSKLEEKPTEGEDEDEDEDEEPAKPEDEEKPTEDEDEDKKGVKASIDATLVRIDSLERTIDKLADVVRRLAELSA